MYILLTHVFFAHFCGRGTSGPRVRLRAELVSYIHWLPYALATKTGLGGAGCGPWPWPP